MSGAMIPQEVIGRQRRASRPDSSAWVRANAGSGKTYVLAQRVLRLLLAGTDPARILCITYTKAAAAEMANRVFEWLGEWTTMPEADLHDALGKLEGRAPTTQEMLRARRLFARAIETPGRLRIQTIHAFCERLLQQFPFEASVTAGFAVLDERAAAELLAEARNGLLRHVADDAELAADIDDLAARAGDATLADLLRSMVFAKGDFLNWIRHGGGLPDLARALGLSPGEDEASVTAEILAGPVLPRSEWPAVAATLETAKSSDRNQAACLREALAATTDEERRECYLRFFFTKEGEPKQRLVTKDISDAHPGLADRLVREQARLIACHDRLKAARILAASSALFRVADAVIERYEKLKGLRGLLDYDDLIEKTDALLTRLDASWVLFKLDGGLDHVLVDEAQDTSPRQWSVIRAIVAEFFSGKGASDRTRTLFAVGDAKQSIYSFQGAAPDRFSQTHRAMSLRASAAGAFEDVTLSLSFRSTEAVLACVDHVFAEAPAAAGLVAPGDLRPEAHQALRARDFGRVEIWDPVLPAEQKQPAPWDAPFDTERPDSPPARLAERIARTIRRWLSEGERLEATGEPIRPGDVMILVRNRAPFAAPMIRALKAHGIPVAGADRMILTAHIAVMDLMALARFCLTPEDDLNLAALMKSPLVGLTEEDLIEVAAQRRGGLWDALRAKEGPRFQAAAERLTGWLGRAGYERPYEFFARVLGPERMRIAFHRRLGAEAFEALDEFLSLTIAYERLETPTLAGFLAWLTAAPSEVKRDMDKGRNEVRVMTVHGAKGLEAPIVFLPDTMRAPNAGRSSPVLAFPEPEDAAPLVWAPRKGDDCTATRALRDAAERRQVEEEHRLLYVAMTRARDRLYVCGYRNSDRETDGHWYDLVRGALEDRLAAATDADGETVYRLESGSATSALRDAAPSPLPADLPGWIAEAAVPERGLATVAPSSLAHEAGRQGAGGAEARRTALERGRALHRLLESLPQVDPEARQARGARALELLAPALSPEMRELLLAEALRILADPRFADAFAPGSQAEVAVAGEVDGIEGLVVGQIDRLGVGESQVLIIDYKSDRLVPDDAASVPAAYSAQLAAYRALLEKLHSGKEIRTAILWTAAPLLMEIAPDVRPSHGTPAAP